MNSTQIAAKIEALTARAIELTNQVTDESTTDYVAHSALHATEMEIHKLRTDLEDTQLHEAIAARGITIDTDLEQAIIAHYVAGSQEIAPLDRRKAELGIDTRAADFSRIVGQGHEYADMDDAEILEDLADDQQTMTTAPLPTDRHLAHLEVHHAALALVHLGRTLPAPLAAAAVTN